MTTFLYGDRPRDAWARSEGADQTLAGWPLLKPDKHACLLCGVPDEAATNRTTDGSWRLFLEETWYSATGRRLETEPTERGGLRVAKVGAVKTPEGWLSCCALCAAADEKTWRQRTFDPDRQTLAPANDPEQGSLL